LLLDDTKEILRTGKKKVRQTAGEFLGGHYAKLRKL
jgi:hypothetical protein